jgi:hypothetical protein
MEETLEEAAERLYPYIDELHLKRAFKQGAKWQQERSYSEEDLYKAFEAGMKFIGEDKGSFKEWFESRIIGKKDGSKNI